MQQLHHAHVSVPDGALQIDRRPNILRVIVAQPLSRIGQRVGPVYVASQKSSGDEMIQHSGQRIGRHSQTASELGPEVTPAVIASATRSVAATRSAIGVIRSAAGHSGPPHASSCSVTSARLSLAMHLYAQRAGHRTYPVETEPRAHTRTKLRRAVNGVAIDEPHLCRDSRQYLIIASDLACPIVTVLRTLDRRHWWKAHDREGSSVQCWGK